MATINVHTRSATFNVETVHGSQLEFVLHAAEERQGLDYAYYTDQLTADLDDRFKDDQDKWMGEYQAYGDVTYTVSASDAMLLQDALAACEEVVIAWAKKFNVERMKPR